MLSTTSTVELFFDDGDWNSTPQLPHYKPATISWGVTSIGQGYNWSQEEEQGKGKDTPTLSPAVEGQYFEMGFVPGSEAAEPQITAHGRKHHHSKSPFLLLKPLVMTPPASPRDSRAPWRPSTPIIQPLARSPTSPRLRRRSSQKRVSLIAGQVLITPIEPPSPPPVLSANLRRTSSNRSFLSQAESARPPSPSGNEAAFLGEKNISEYLIEGDIGSGAYGLVKRAREIHEDGSLGVSKSFSKISIVSNAVFHRAAAPGDQTGHKVADIGRLLEEASKAWHDPHRDLRHVRYFQYFICAATSPTLAPTSLFALA